jgi:hypothetical protein
MSDRSSVDGGVTLLKIREQVRAGRLPITQHAHQEMVEEDVLMDDVTDVLDNGRTIEDYPSHRRGACCLVAGTTSAGRPLHVVCTTGEPVVVVITVYEPRAPRWLSPTQRRKL